MSIQVIVWTLVGLAVFLAGEYVAGAIFIAVGQAWAIAFADRS